MSVHLTCDEINHRFDNYSLILSGYLISMQVNITSFACGTAFAWSSPVVPKLKTFPGAGDNPLSAAITQEEESWIVSLLSLGAAFGPFVGGYGSDKIGCKTTLILSTVPTIVSFLMTAFGTNVLTFYIARIMVGVSCGIVLTVTPMYIGEVAEINNRGTLGCFMVAFIAIGYVYTYSIGPYVSIMWLGLACTIGPIICLVIFAIFIPESPYYLVAQGKQKEAENSLLKLRYKDKTIAHKELLEVSNTVTKSLEGKGGVVDIFRNRGLLKGLIVTMGLVCLQQACGISVVLFYMQSIFESSGTSISPDVAAITVAVVQLIGSVSASLVVERLGRKILLYISSLGTSVTLVALGTYFYLKDAGQDVDALFWLPITSLIIYIATYNLGLGPIPYAVLGEIFPPQVKSAASSLTVCVCLILSFLTAKFFPILIEVIGNGFSFWIFGISTALGLSFTYLTVPETRGKTLSEIQYELSK